MKEIDCTVMNNERMGVNLNEERAENEFQFEKMKRIPINS